MVGKRVAARAARQKQATESNEKIVSSVKLLARKRKMPSL